MKRIVYKLNATTGFYESTPILTGLGASVASYQGLNYKLISYDTGLTIIEGKSTSTHMLKRNIKHELIIRGAVFEDEIRKFKK